MAKETAPRKDNATETKTDPITELVTGSGGTKPAGAPLDREEPSSSRKVLFGGTLKSSKTQGSPKSFFEYDDEDGALEAAIAEVNAGSGKKDDDGKKAGFGNEPEEATDSPGVAGTTVGDDAGPDRL